MSEWLRELARKELERNPPPPASPELVAKLSAIFSGVQVPDMDNARAENPGAAAEPHPLPDEKKSSDQRNTAA